MASLLESPRGVRRRALQLAVAAGLSCFVALALVAYLFTPPRSLVADRDSEAIKILKELAEERARRELSVAEMELQDLRNSSAARASARPPACAPADRFVFGIPTVSRYKNYLVDTMNSVMRGVPEADRQRVKFVVLNGQEPPEAHSAVAALRSARRADLDSGHLTIIEKRGGHAEMNGTLKRTHGDSIERVRWRSKQAPPPAPLPAAPLKLPSSSLPLCHPYLAYILYGPYLRPPAGEYYIQLEDDVVAAAGWFTEMESWTRKHFARRCDWLMLSFYTPYRIADREEYTGGFWGFIGQLYRTGDLPGIARHFRARFDESPVDWLMDEYARSSRRAIFAHAPSLFQHVGTVSSLPGKVQDAKAPDFAGDRHRAPGPGPAR
eukprot:tig00000792_g4158.t1